MDEEEMREFEIRRIDGDADHTTVLREARMEVVYAFAFLALLIFFGAVLVQGVKKVWGVDATGLFVILNFMVLTFLVTVLLAVTLFITALVVVGFGLLRALYRINNGAYIILNEPMIEQWLQPSFHLNLHARYVLELLPDLQMWAENSFGYQPSVDFVSRDATNGWVIVLFRSASDAVYFKLGCQQPDKA